MARFHIFECSIPEEGSIIVVHKSHPTRELASTSLCDTGKEAMFAYLQLCDHDSPNEISFQPPASDAAIVKDATYLRNFDPKGVDLFKSLLCPVFVD